MTASSLCIAASPVQYVESSQFLGQPLVDDRGAVLNEALVFALLKLLPQISVDAQGHRDTVAQAHAWRPTDAAVGLGLPGLPRGQAVIGDFTRVNANLPARAIQPHNKCFAAERLDDTADAEMAPDLQAYFVPGFRLHVKRANGKTN